jgi:hypothetical protein
MVYPYPVFPFTEVEFDFWPRTAIGTATDGTEAEGLIRSRREDMAGATCVKLIRRPFCGILPGHCAETIARCNRLPPGTWELCGPPGYRVIEVTGWFLPKGGEREAPRRQKAALHG